MLEIFKVLSDENRLRILYILMNYNLCVCELETVLEMTQSNVSRHLARLKNAGLISSSKDAQWIHYQFDESIRNEHEKLVSYLRQKFMQSTMHLNDLNRCRIYKDSEYDCQTIRNDKELVMTYINNKVQNL